MNTPIEIKAPSSKSMSHRAFIAASLAAGDSLVADALESDDLLRTRQCLTAAGARFEAVAEGWKITGVGGRPQGGEAGAEPADCNMGESGTSCRLLTAVLGAGRGRFRVHGEGRLHDRPMGQLTDVLERLGVTFRWEGTPGYPPFVMETSGFKGVQAAIPLDESSQYLSGLLLAAPLGTQELRIDIAGSKVVSWPYVSLSLMVMADFGIDYLVEALEGDRWVGRAATEVTAVTPGKLRFTVRPGCYKARPYRVEGDWSNASYFLAAGAVGPRPVRVTGLRPDSLQGDKAILEILTAMGATVAWDATGVTVSPPGTTPAGAATGTPRDDVAAGLHGVELDMGSCPDLVPTVAATAALAPLGSGTTTIRNVAHLRIKESDRLQACADELAKLGAKTVTFADGLSVTPGPLPRGQRVELRTYDDHRMAMSLSLFGLAGVEVALDNPKCVAKSFPGFWDAWRKIA